MTSKKIHTAFHNKIAIPNPDDPFQQDYTGRYCELSADFTRFIEKQTWHKPLVVLINASWGAGKTTFIDMWGQSLLNGKKTAIKFDAWHWDHSDTPLLAIVAEL